MMASQSASSMSGECGKHDVRGFRIEGDVEFGRRGDVAVRADRTPHHHAAGDPLRQGRVELQRQRDVGQRAQRDQQQPASMLMRQPQDGQGGVFGLGLACRRRVAGIAKAIAAMHIGGVHARDAARARRQPANTGTSHAADIAQLQGVGDGVFQADIAGGDGQGHDVMARVVESHQQGERVVHARVGIDQEGNAGHLSSTHYRVMPEA